jgi:hypothetical protein
MKTDIRLTVEHDRDIQPEQAKQLVCDAVNSLGYLQVKCAWCGDDLGLKECLPSQSGVSHGVCQDCRVGVIQEFQSLIEQDKRKAVSDA